MEDKDDLTQKILGAFSGMMIGFTLFRPEQDMWALLGFVFSIIGAGIGMTPHARRNNAVVFGALVGFYIGTLLAILLFGNIVADDLLEVVEYSVN